ncbi:MAG: DUF3368 domain-containing protein [Clostridiales bacterium]|nr:DUF3368 domain-containing protein [Clostridiales bacterium]
MIIVSDSTPIISLLKIHHLDLLYHLFGEIWIPRAVYQELTFNKKFRQEAEQIINSEYIKKVTVEDARFVNRFRQKNGLDIGESEAIILSDEYKADILLMDEVKGRKVAKQMGLQVMGTIGILMAAFDERLLSSEDMEQCIKVLQDSGRHISDRLYKELIDRVRGI